MSDIWDDLKLRLAPKDDDDSDDEDDDDDEDEKGDDEEGRTCFADLGGS